MTWSNAAARLLGPAGKRRVGTIAEGCWAAGFAALGALARRRPRSWPDAARSRRVLVVAPHPDDESIGCAGTLLLHKRAGATVVVACVTDGRTSRALGLGPEEMGRRRRVEADECARRLGIDHLEWLGLPGGGWHDEQLTGGLATVMARHRPDAVYAPSCVDFHPEHRQVARVLGRFWADSPARPEAVRVYAVQVPLTHALANLVVDISDVIDQVRAAFDAYTTQLANMSRAVRQRRYAARRYRAGTHAEEFWQMSAASYSRLHGAAMPGAGEFRGLREHPIFDPAAYLAGARSRRRLSSALS